MESFQTLKNRFTRLLLDHRWLLLLVLGALALLFEVFEHWGEDDPVDAHFIREIFFFGVMYPLVVGMLLSLLLRVQAERNAIVRQQAWEERLRQELRQAASWSEMVKVIVYFPQRFVPVVGVSFLHVDLEDMAMKGVGEWWLGDAGGENRGKTAVYPALCGVQTHHPGQRLHPFVSSPMAAYHSYCLPFWNGDLLAGLLHLHLPLAEQLSVEQITLLNQSASVIEPALAAATREHPEFLQATAVHQERKRIALRLHNTLGQNLSYLRLKLDELTLDDTLRQQTAVFQDLERMRDIANEAYEQVRHTMTSLQPESPPSLTEALLLQAQLTAEQSGLIFHHQVQGDARPVPPLAQHKILFIFREAFANVQRHAQATIVTMTITWTPGNLAVSLLDDGVGFDSDQPAVYGCFGLLIMQQRAEELEGRLSVQSRPGQGTRVLLQCPLNEES